MIYIVETSDWRGDYSIGHLLDCKEPNAIKKYNEYKVRVAKDTYGIELDGELLFPIIKYHNMSEEQQEMYRRHRIWSSEYTFTMFCIERYNANKIDYQHYTEL